MAWSPASYQVFKEDPRSLTPVQMHAGISLGGKADPIAIEVIGFFHGDPQAENDEDFQDFITASYQLQTLNYLLEQYQESPTLHVFAENLDQEMSPQDFLLMVDKNKFRGLLPVAFPFQNGELDVGPGFFSSNQLVEWSEGSKITLGTARKILLNKYGSFQILPMIAALDCESRGFLKAGSKAGVHVHPTVTSDMLERTEVIFSLSSSTKEQKSENNREREKMYMDFVVRKSAKDPRIKRAILLTGLAHIGHIAALLPEAYSQVLESDRPTRMDFKVICYRFPEGLGAFSSFAKLCCPPSSECPAP